jgi:hypothetical protein
VTYAECSPFYPGATIPEPFEVQAQRGDMLFGVIGVHNYQASGQVAPGQWTLAGTQCDLDMNCCATLAIRAALGPLPEQADFAYHYECSYDHTRCDVEAFKDGFVYEVR